MKVSLKRMMQLFGADPFFNIKQQTINNLICKQTMKLLKEIKSLMIY